MAVMQHQGTGRRKKSIARVRLLPGDGRIEVNERDFEEYFDLATMRERVLTPLRLTNTLAKFDVFARVEGGGVSGQAGALRHAISRALAEGEPELRGKLKKAGLLTRDERMKERKKYGRKKARKSPQFSKR